MKASLIILGVTAAVNASFADSRLQRRTSCSAYEYEKCCGTGSGSWKRSLEARTICKYCNCPPPAVTTTAAVQYPTTTTTSSQITTTPSLTTMTTEVRTTTTAVVNTPPPQETGPGSCKATINGPSGQFTDASGTKYTVNCGKDIAGGDFAAKPAASFADCFSLCSQSDVCVGFSWLSGNCYLKSSQNGGLSESPADVAQKVNPPAPKPTTTTTTAAGPAPTGACKALGSSFGAYTVECGIDYPGGDLSNAPSESFAGCAAQCDKLAGCIGFSFVGGNGSGQCYFKDTKNNASPNTGVDSAFRPSPVIPAAPTTTTTTTAQITTTTAAATTTTAVVTTTTAKITTTTTTKAAEPTPSITYDFQLFDDYSCKRSTGTLRISRARAGECISLDALTKSDSFRYKPSGGDGRCRVVAFDRKDCSGKSVVLSPTDFSQQCIPNYDALRLECN